MGNRNKTTLVNRSTYSGVYIKLDTTIFRKGVKIQYSVLVNIDHHNNFSGFLKQPYKLLAIKSIKKAVARLLNLGVGSNGAPPIVVGMASKVNNANWVKILHLRPSYISSEKLIGIAKSIVNKKLDPAIPVDNVPMYETNAATTTCNTAIRIIAAQFT